MIKLVEALNYRSLRYVRQRLNSLNVLVGPNASGKTTFLDVPALLGDLVQGGVEGAIGDRTPNFEDLVWRKLTTAFELAIEAEIPEERRKNLERTEFDTIRYEVQLGLHPETGEISILAEKVVLKSEQKSFHETQPRLFPEPPPPPETILTPTTKGIKTVVNKVFGGNDYFCNEIGKDEWDHAFKLGQRKSALGNLPEDETKFPVSTWLKRLLIDGVQRFVLNSLLIRKASPPGQKRGFKPDGSNLPWVVAELEKKSPERISDWVSHLRTSLPDLEEIRTIERKDDKHCYLMLRYAKGFEVPSWVVSDGTLRLLALTLPSYLMDFQGVYLIEEPENGVHPRAVETLFQSLSSVYDAQILMATHSPVILSIVEPENLLCFAKNEEGATDIVDGLTHPMLKDWRRETDLGSLFAAGVLG